MSILILIIYFIIHYIIIDTAIRMAKEKGYDPLLCGGLGALVGFWALIILKSVESKKTTEKNKLLEDVK